MSTAVASQTDVERVLVEVTSLLLECARIELEREVVRQLRGQAGDRQVPGNPKVGYTQLYGAPGTAGVSILSR